MRRDLIPLLLNRSMSVTAIARATDRSPRDAEDDLRHLIKSLKHMEYEAVLVSAQCRKCGFEFEADKLRKPSKCPECRATWISEPKISVVPRTQS